MKDIPHRPHTDETAPYTLTDTVGYMNEQAGAVYSRCSDRVSRLNFHSRTAVIDYR